jgi:hypothetical protein
VWRFLRLHEWERGPHNILWWYKNVKKDGSFCHAHSRAQEPPTQALGAEHARRGPWIRREHARGMWAVSPWVAAISQLLMTASPKKKVTDDSMVVRDSVRWQTSQTEYVVLDESMTALEISFLQLGVSKLALNIASCLWCAWRLRPPAGHRPRRRAHDTRSASW